MAKLIKLKVFLERTGIDRLTAYRLIRRGELRAIQPSGRRKSDWYVLDSEIDRMLDAAEQAMSPQVQK